MDDLTQARHDLAMMQTRYNNDVTRLEHQLTAEVGDHQVAERQQLLGEASFGAFDGMTSVTGVVVALFSRPVSAIVVAAIGLAVASFVGMAAGEYLGDTGEGALRRSGVMGAATIFGTLVPTVPFFLTSDKSTAVAIAAIIAVAVSTVIGWCRREGAKGYVVTYTILAVAVGATIGVSALIPASAGG